MTPELVLLDLDGTLTDSAPGILASVRYAYAQLGVPAPSTEQLTRFVGPPIQESFRTHGISQQQLPAAIAAYREAFTDGGMFNNSVYTGIEACLTRLQDAGIRMALATSKPEIYAKQITERFGLNVFLEAEFGASLDASRGEKADVISYGLAELKASPAGLPDLSRILMVGDRLHDVLGARANNLDCVGVSWGYAAAGELAEAGAIAVVDSPAQLADLVLND